MSGEEKLNTCRHRSLFIEIKEVHKCCDIYEKELGYNCELRNIFPLNKDICVHCGLYETKQV